MKYLASPYTHPDPFIREERYLRAMKVLTTLLNNRIWTYSPIVHCHELAKVGGLPHDAQFWKDYDFHTLATCDGLFVLRIEGWEESKGVQGEIKEAERLGLTVTYI